MDDTAQPLVVEPVETAHFDFGLGESAPTAQPRQRTPLEVVALVLAVLIAPLGLVVSIVAAVLSSRRLGYVNSLARAALAVAIVLSLVWAAGGAALGYYRAVQDHEAALRSQSAAMCAILATKPGALADPAFGWPAMTSTIPAYQDAVASYEKWWQSVAAVAPTAERTDVAAVLQAAETANSRMTVSTVIDHDRDYADLRAVAEHSTLPGWAARYCSG